MTAPRRPWGPRRTLAGLALVAVLVMVDDPAGATPAAGPSLASTVSSLHLHVPSVARDARDGWPMRATRAHRADIARGVARSLRAAGCHVGRVRPRPLRGAGVWEVRTTARKGSPRPWIACETYRRIRVRVWEDGSARGWPTPPPRPVHITTTTEV